MEKKGHLTVQKLTSTCQIVASPYEPKDKPPAREPRRRSPAGRSRRAPSLSPPPPRRRERSLSPLPRDDHRRTVRVSDVPDRSKRSRRH